MARMPVTPYRPDPPPDLELSPLFDIEGNDGAAKWVREKLKWPATPRWIHDHTIAGHIRYTRALGKRRYSSLELYNFVMAQSKVGGERQKGNKTA
jgi:hypothetical protein